VSDNSEQRWRAVKAHIAKGDKAKDKAEQHYIAAGQHLASLKAEHTGSWGEWEVLVKERAGIGKSRASELMQIADGTKTVEQVRERSTESSGASHAKARALANAPLISGENASDPEASAERMKAKFAEIDGAEDKDEEEAEDPATAGLSGWSTPAGSNGSTEGLVNVSKEEGFGTFVTPEVAAVLQTVERMSAADRGRLLDELAERYPSEDEFTIYAGESHESVVRTLVEAIGVDGARALGKNMSGLIFRAVGRAALPDCQWCQGSGHADRDFNGQTVKVRCDCTRRKRGEDFAALRARLESEDREQQIPEQGFSFGLEVTTKDGKVWASGVRLPTEEEAKFYIDYWARGELRKHGYVTWEGEPNDLLAFEIKRYDEQPMMKISGGRRKTMNFMHGTCGLLGPSGWRPISGGECDCKICKSGREWSEDQKRFREEYEIVERAHAGGEISQEQYAEWEDFPDNKSPEWLVRLMRSQPPAAAS
jgi:hypothetical protein